MKVRIKFTKEGAMKFVGHLDTMRYFQKAIRRAELPIAFSGGFSPHMIMSFAAPLGVGVTSKGEYFDMELTKELSTDEIRERLDAQMAEGVRVLSARKVEDGKASKAMSLVAAADYLVEFRPGKEPVCPAFDGLMKSEAPLESFWKEKVQEFLAQPEISFTKETKKGTKEVNLRPFIYAMEVKGDAIFLSLASASANYTKPEAVMDSYLEWLGVEKQPFAYQVERLEVYADLGTEETHQFVTLEDLGETVE